MAHLARSFNFPKIKGVLQTITKSLATVTVQKSHVNHVNVQMPIMAQKIAKNLLLTNNNSWIYKENDEIISPIYRGHIKITDDLWAPFPTGITNDRIVNIIEAPSAPENAEEKRAERMIVIRRKKMKKHKLRKLRKRMRFEWAKIRQKRELLKEKTFQAKLIAQYTEAEAFNPEKYIQDRLKALHEEIPENVSPHKEVPKRV